MRIRIENCDLFDGLGDSLARGMHVLVADGRVAEVSDRALTAAAERVLDATGLTLMPGLIDAHVHVSAASPSLGAVETMSPAWVAHWTARNLSEMLDRGFTSVRDMGGGEAGTKRAQAEGLIRGPRLFTCGKALGQTGGHTDYRGTSRADMGDLHRRYAPGIGRIVDGVPGMLAAARDELRLGNDFVKIMANGGVASPTDPIDWIQFTAEEIAAAVAVAEASCTYVAAHTYTARAIEHAAVNGVRSLEHCNLIDDRVAAVLRARGCYAVPTLVAYDCLERHADTIGLGPANREKNRKVRAAGLTSLEIIDRAGVPMGFGTDLLGWMGRDQLVEFALRARVQPAAAILRSATSVNAALLGRPDLGHVAPGATADLILVDGDPLADPGGCLSGQGERVLLVLQEGRPAKDRVAG
ncbi:MAG: amidohydrolase family protein [Rhodobacteraceae bacterium]|jgi:imidazolonepropionase-like amidohydrolase|nr:amidohydrolase family protein [Paracoccaceae bacterium]